MEFIKGTAICTGGGIYTFIGETSTGEFFYADNFAVGIYDSDTTQEDENGDFRIYDCTWQALHEITELSQYDALCNETINFIKRLIAGTQDESGYEHLKNYCVSDLEHLI